MSHTHTQIRRSPEAAKEPVSCCFEFNYSPGYNAVTLLLHPATENSPLDGEKEQSGQKAAVEKKEQEEDKKVQKALQHVLQLPKSDRRFFLDLMNDYASKHNSEQLQARILFSVAHGYSCFDESDCVNRIKYFKAAQSKLASNDNLSTLCALYVTELTIFDDNDEIPTPSFQLIPNPHVVPEIEKIKFILRTAKVHFHEDIEDYLIFAEKELGSLIFRGAEEVYPLWVKTRLFAAEKHIFDALRTANSNVQEIFAEEQERVIRMQIDHKDPLYGDYLFFLAQLVLARYHDKPNASDLQRIRKLYFPQQSPLFKCKHLQVAVLELEAAIAVALKNEEAFLAVERKLNRLSVTNNITSLITARWKHQWVATCANKYLKNEFIFDRTAFIESAVITFSDSRLFKVGGHIMQFRLQQCLTALSGAFKKAFKDTPKFDNQLPIGVAQFPPDSDSDTDSV